MNRVRGRDTMLVRHLYASRRRELVMKVDHVILSVLEEFV